MSVQTRIMPAGDADQGFGLLKDIVDMVKNPDAIDEAYERRREAAKLTDVEVQKAEDARALIASADALAAALKTREDVIIADREEHIAAVKEFAEHVQAETTRLNEREVNLNQGNGELNAAKLALDSDRKEFESRSAKLDIDAAARSENLTSREAAIKNTESVQEEESIRLAAWRDKLTAKAAKLVAVAESDD